MQTTSDDAELSPGYDARLLRESIRDNLWIHFTQMAPYRDPDHRQLMLVRGDGSTVWDADLDLLAGI